MPSGMESKREVVGLVPAAGAAERVSPLPCSKEIFPIGFHTDRNTCARRPKAAAHYLLENMQNAGAEKAFIVIRKGKWDIPAYFSGEGIDCIPLAFIPLNATTSVPFTIDQAFPFLKTSMILFGFPDILSTPNTSFGDLIGVQQTSDADIVLGLYKADRPEKMDMLEMDADNRIRKIHIKPSETLLRYTWIMAVWTPRFSLFLHHFLKQSSFTSHKELYLGDVIQAAIEDDLSVDTHIFHTGKYIDIGTPEDLQKAVGTWR